MLSEDELLALETNVAYGCGKYADLSHIRNHEYIFSNVKILEDTSMYMLNSYSRIRSIARTAKMSEQQLVEAKKGGLQLEHKKELKLGTQLLRFGDVLARMENGLFLLAHCELMYRVANMFTEFCKDCYCLEKDKIGKIGI